MNTFQATFFWIGVACTASAVFFIGVAFWLSCNPEEREEKEKHEWMVNRYGSLDKT